MEQQQNTTGPGGRRLHIAHRRSPSELTPLMMEQLALQQQIEMLQVQQQQMLNAHQQYANMGLLPTGQTHLSPASFAQLQHQQIPNISPQQPQNAFQFPQHQQGAAPPGAPTQPSSHRRNQSAMPGMGGANGPPPAPSSGSAGAAFGEFSLNTTNTAAGNNSTPQRRASGGQGGGDRGHQRRHSLALPEAKKAAELAQAKRGGNAQSNFQFPAIGTTSPTTTSATPSGSVNTPTSATDSSSPASANAGGQTQNQGAALGPPRSRMSGHGRSQSLAVGANGRSPAGGRIGGFQFPPPMATNDAGANSANTNQGTQGGNQQQQQGGQGGQGVERRGSGSGFQGHNRTGSRNYEGNWRNQNQNQQHQSNASIDIQNQNQQLGGQQFNNPGFQPGHRSRASLGGSIGSFQFPAQPNLLPLGAGAQGIFINPATGQPQLINAGLLQHQQQLTQLQIQQAAALGAQQLGLGNLAQGANQNLANQQQQRKTLFTPYLPQASLPALLSNGQLVSGILRVNKKNRSDAYVSTQDGLLDADIFICGSKDRNRALEGDLVAVELLDVDEVWGQKREKEEKKKRKDISDGSRASVSTSSNVDSGTTEGGQEQSGQPGVMRRRGSLRQRPTQKKNDDVEVEGQGLLLVEEEEVNDEQKPLYAGHIVAVIERVAGQMFSGTLGLLRPSSQATKEKQEAERQAREGHSGRSFQPERNTEKPKIVWFKPTDKRVPLIAIPTEQAPRDFVENHQSYANRIFVACIKRWPITSLHPFGTLVEQLGEMGDMKVETDALLRDNNFGPDDFSDAVLRNVGLEDWSVESEGEEFISARKDFKELPTFSISAKEGTEINQAFHVKKAREGVWEIGVHVADVTHFVKANSLVDREAKKRGTGVELINRSVPMLPPKVAEDLASLKLDQDRLSFSVVFNVEESTGKILEEETWIGKGIVKNNVNLLYSNVDALVFGEESAAIPEDLKEGVSVLRKLTKQFRGQRYGTEIEDIPALRLLYQLDDENIPVEENIFDSRPAYEIVEELSIRTNAFVAQKLVAGLPEKALLRRQSAPNQRRLENFGDRMNRFDYKIEISSSAALQSSLFSLPDSSVGKGMETVLIKGMQRAKYFIGGKLPEELHNHYVYNLPVYTHFTNPIRRYTDIIVHRQLEAVLSNGAIEFSEDIDTLTKTAEQCNVKKDSAKNAQEQSIHISLCRAVDKRRQDNGGELICEAIVINVYESAFDVLIPEYGFEKRVHCDQLPLKKAEFDKTNRVLELYWEKGVQSNAYIPEDERPKGGAALRAANAAAAASAAAAAAKAAQEQEEIQRKMMEISSLSIDDVDALFDGDEEASDESPEQPTSSLMPPQPLTRPTQSMPGSPTKSPTTSQTPHRTRSDPKMSVTAHDSEKLDHEFTDKERYLAMFTLREEKSDYIQEVRELSRVPVFLKTELSKSPPCLTIRSLNPYAL
ncbi:Translational repressor [Rhizina undulata]